MYESPRQTGNSLPLAPFVSSLDRPKVRVTETPTDIGGVNRRFRGDKRDKTERKEKGTEGPVPRRNGPSQSGDEDVWVGSRRTENSDSWSEGDCPSKGSNEGNRN